MYKFNIFKANKVMIYNIRKQEARDQFIKKGKWIIMKIKSIIYDIGQFPGKTQSW